jgi:hypothetical protein
MKGKKHNGDRHREEHRAKGGRVEGENANPDTGWEADDKEASEVYEGKGSKVLEGAKKRRCGGKVDGKEAMKRLDRKPRAKGGRVGSDKAPLSMAASVSNRPGGKMDQEND